MIEITRRDVIRQTAALGAALTVGPRLVGGRRWRGAAGPPGTLRAARGRRRRRVHRPQHEPVPAPVVRRHRHGDAVPQHRRGRELAGRAEHQRGLPAAAQRPGLSRPSGHRLQRHPQRRLPCAGRRRADALAGRRPDLAADAARRRSSARAVLVSGLEPAGPGVRRPRRRFRRDRRRRRRLDPARRRAMGRARGLFLDPVTERALCGVRRRRPRLVRRRRRLHAGRAGDRPASLRRGAEGVVAASSPMSATLATAARCSSARPSGMAPATAGGSAAASAPSMSRWPRTTTRFTSPARAACPNQAGTNVWRSRARRRLRAASSARPTRATERRPGRPCSRAPSASTSATGTAAITPSR